MNQPHLTRREALGLAAGTVLAGCATTGQAGQTVQAGQSAVLESGAGRGAAELAGLEPPHRSAPAVELVNSMEYAEQARLVLPPDVFARLEGHDREPFNRITLHQQLGSPTLDMDLSMPLFGKTLFTPLLVGAVPNLEAYHEQGLAGVVSGAAGAYSGVIASSRSSVPFRQLVGQTSELLWFNVYSEREAPDQAAGAVEGGAEVIFVTLGDPEAARSGRIGWGQFDGVRSRVSVPVVARGIRTPGEAAEALQHGAQGIVVSNRGAATAAAGETPLEMLPAIAEAVGGRAPILYETGVRRGSDVVKVLALGAQAAIINRPAAWALAAYGSDGVQVLMELMHNEIARAFAMLGVSSPGALTPEHIRLHRWATA